jgi:hypothetical protein
MMRTSKPPHWKLAREFHGFHYLRRNGNRPSRRIIVTVTGGDASDIDALIHLRFQSRRNAMINPSMFLRRAIQADAVFSAVSAVLLTFGAGEFASLLKLPEPLLREAGLFLIAYAALVGWLGTRPTMPKILVAVVIAGNALWTVASIGLLFSSEIAPNLLGEAAITMQAIVTGVLAELQFIGLRRSGGAIAA